VGWNNPIPVVWNAMVPSYDWLKWDVTVSFDIWLKELTWVVWMVVFDTDSYNTYGPTYHPINILFCRSWAYLDGGVNGVNGANLPLIYP
jgi:hypothetical protein